MAGEILDGNERRLHRRIRRLTHSISRVCILDCGLSAAFDSPHSFDYSTAYSWYGQSLSCLLLCGRFPYVFRHVKLLPAFTRPRSFGRASRQISDHLTWAGANAASIAGVKHACHVTWPLFMLEQCGFLPVRSIWGMIGATTRALRSCRLAPAFLKPPGPPRAMLDRVRRQCLGVEEGGGGLVLVTSFGIEPPRDLPPCLKVIGRGHLPETVEALEQHPELKVIVTRGEGRGCGDSISRNADIGLAYVTKCT